MLERLVVPVESAARLGCRDEQAEEHRAEERVVLGRMRSGVGAGEDRRGGLAGELVERETSVFTRPQQRLALLDERTHERAQLVQRRPLPLDVLLERERQLGALLELPAENDEGPEDEAAQERIEMRRAHGHVFPRTRPGPAVLS